MVLLELSFFKLRAPVTFGTLFLRKFSMFSYTALDQMSAKLLLIFDQLL